MNKINCLSLNEDAVFQNKILAKYQLEQKFNLEKKILYLNYKLNQTKIYRKWDDLGLYEYDFFGIMDHEYFFMSEDDIKNFKYPNIIHECIDSDKFIFLTAHEDEYILKLLNCWKNSKFITFINQKSFIKYRNIPFKQSKNYYDESPFKDIDKNEIILPDPIYKWDTNWYFFPEKTLLKIQELYDILNIGGFNSKIISWYYNKWMGILNELK